MLFSLRNKVLVFIILAFLILGIIAGALGMAVMMSGHSVYGAWITGTGVIVFLVAFLCIVLLIITRYRQLSEPAKLVSEYMNQLMAYQTSIREKTAFFPWFYVIRAEDKATHALMTALRFRLLPPDNDKVLNWIEIWTEGRTVFICPSNKLLSLDKRDPLLSELLGRIHHYRKSRTFSGVLIDTSPSVLQDNAVFGQELPQHIIRLCERIGQSLPILFMTAGIDAVFSKAVLNRNFSREERSKAWGAWRDELQRPASEWFAESWQSQMQQLFCKQIHAISNDYDDALCNDSVALVFEFIQLGAWLGKLVKYFDRAFEKQRPQLRGYFLVASGETESVTSLLAKWCHQYFGLSTALKHPCTPDVAFASGLFHQVFLPMSQYAGTNRSAQFFHRMWGSAFIAGVFLFVGGAAWWCYQNLDRLEQLNAETSRVVDTYVTERIRARAISEESLESTLEQLQILQTLNKTYETLPMRFLIAHWAVRGFSNTFRHFYDEQLKSRLYPYLVKSAAQALEVQLANAEIQSVFDRLRLYQMLYDPDLLHKRELIQGLLPVVSEERGLSVINEYRLAEQVGDLLSLSDYQVQLPDVSLLNQARDSLSGLSDSQLAYRRLKSDPELMRPVPLAKLLGSNFNKVFQLDSGKQKDCPSDIPLLFTLESWNENLMSPDSRLFKKIYSDIDNIKGIEARPGSDYMSAASGELHHRYVLEYISQWNQVLSCIHVKPLRDFVAIREASSNLAQWEFSSLAGILEMIDRNTRLLAEPLPSADSSKANVDMTLDMSGRQEVVKAFEPYHRLIQGDSVIEFAGRCQGIINDLYQKIMQMEQCDDKQKCAYQQLVDIVEARHPLNALVSFADPQPEQTKRWLVELSHELASYYIENGGQYLQRQWEERVVLPYTRYLKNHYPLVRTSSKDANFKQFAVFFQTGGQLDGFVKTYLAPFIDDQRLKVLIPGKVLPVRRQLLETIRIGKQINQSFFLSDGASLDVFQVRIISMSPTATHFVVQDKNNLIRYDHGPNLWQDIDLSNEGGFVEATFFSQEAPLSHASYTGDWSWFRFFSENFRYSDRAASIGSTHFSLGDQTISFEIMDRNSRKRLPFDPTLMAQFHFIERIF